MFLWLYCCAKDVLYNNILGFGMGFVVESSKKLKVDGFYDVVVAGGGFAGIAAALAAKRNGAKKVLLLERQFALGGLGTLGLVTIYLPLCDGMGNQVCFGISEELLKLSIKHGAEDMYPDAWLNGGSDRSKSTQRYQVRYNAHICAIVMEQLLLEEGVEILYGTTVCGCLKEGEKIIHLIVENKSGRSAIGVRSVVDTTGDADIFKLAGAETVMFSQKNILASWYYYTNQGKNNLKMLGFSDLPDKYKDKTVDDSKKKRYTGIEAKELSEMTIDSHDNILRHFLKDGELTAERAITTIASIPQVRMTRRIAGRYVLDDSQTGTNYDDCIGIVPNWRRAGPTYKIPLRSLYGSQIKNLITAGRSISVTDAMWDITRVIPCCAVTGEAAGTAAALTDDFSTIDIKKLQKLLKQNGVNI